VRLLAPCIQTFLIGLKKVQLTNNSQKKIAVIGSGAAGLTAAYLLDSIHAVTLFEKADRLGGHTNTITLASGPDAGTPIDTGFIVFNEKNYPLLCRLFKRLGVETDFTDMAFGLACRETGLEYCSDFPKGLFAQKRNYFKPSFIFFIREIMRVNRLAKQQLQDGVMAGQTLADWLESVKASPAYRQFYLLPMGAAIWSTPTAEMLRFPAEMFLRFFDNHGLWDLKNRPRWKFVCGGSQTYVKKIQAGFKGSIRLNSGVVKIKRDANQVEVHTAQGVETFDAVVLAAHADESYAMLTDPSDVEKQVLSVWKYTRNEAVLHWDDALMPKRKAAWASWNYTVWNRIAEKTRVSVTYWMNRLQNLKTSRPYFVTLNATDYIDPQKVIRKFIYTHPHYDFLSLSSQSTLPQLNGKLNTYYCGSYFGNGFHEDAVRSAVQVAEKLGARL